MTHNRVRSKGNAAKPLRSDGVPVPAGAGDLEPSNVPAVNNPMCLNPNTGGRDAS